MITKETYLTSLTKELIEEYNTPSFEKYLNSTEYKERVADLYFMGYTESEAYKVITEELASQY